MNRGSRLSAVRVIGLDIVGPLVTYRLLRSAGVSQVWSLVLSGCLPGIGVVFDYVRWRTLEVVGAIVLGGIALRAAPPNRRGAVADSSASTRSVRSTRCGTPSTCLVTTVSVTDLDR